MKKRRETERDIVEIRPLNNFEIMVLVLASVLFKKKVLAQILEHLIDSQYLSKSIMTGTAHTLW